MATSAAIEASAARVQGRFHFGDDGGPGGWWIIIEPGIAIAELDVEEIVPDVAGWRRERLPELPDRFATAPDWVCEVLSPSTRRHELRTKRPLYGEAGVRFMWIVELDARTLIASENQGGKWLELGVWSDDDVVNVAPFEELPLKLSDLLVSFARGRGPRQRAEPLRRHRGERERAERVRTPAVTGRSIKRAGSPPAPRSGRADLRHLQIA